MKFLRQSIKCPFVRIIFFGDYGNITNFWPNNAFLRVLYPNNRFQIKNADALEIETADLDRKVEDSDEQVRQIGRGELKEDTDI